MNKVREFREKRLMTRSELAKAADLSISTIARIEQGKDERPSIRTIRKILSALEIPPEKKELVFL
ncbi:MAG: helix-turn-helix transcriptional regulator [bacterium]|nr:helix-turn-helix transcriptional regulator [bacterium]